MGRPFFIFMTMVGFEASGGRVPAQDLSLHEAPKKLAWLTDLLEKMM